MSKAYSRTCRNCGEPINMRKMPHGQWVAFEGYDTPHAPRCGKKSPIIRRKTDSSSFSDPLSDIGFHDVNVPRSSSRVDKEIGGGTRQQKETYKPKYQSKSYSRPKNYSSSNRSKKHQTGTDWGSVLVWLGIIWFALSFCASIS
jgi:hypothetical protein